MNVSKLYWLLGFLHIVCYVYYRNQKKTIDEDLSEYTGGRCGIRAFVSVLPQKEYRYIFYYRIPFFICHILNFILPRTTNCYLHTVEVLGGGKNCSWLLLNYCGKKHWSSFPFFPKRDGGLG